MSLSCKTLGKVLGLQLHARLDKGEWRCNTSTKVNELTSNENSNNFEDGGGGGEIMRQNFEKFTTQKLLQLLRFRFHFFIES